MLMPCTLSVVIVLSELKSAMSYRQSFSGWLFDNVIGSDGSVSGSFITFDTAVAQAAVGDSPFPLWQ